MAFFLRQSTVPSLADITAVPQIVIVDQTGPTISIGTAPGIAAIVGEFTRGPFVPTEVTSGGQQAAIFGDVVYPYFSQSAAGVQDGSAAGYAGYNGNGNLSLLNRTFRRLAICRVDHEAVTADAGATKAQLSVTLTVSVNDQDGSGNLAHDIVIPAGARFGSASTFAASTRVFAASGDTVVKKGTALTANAVVVLVNCFPVRVVEPVVATAIAAIAFVLDPVVPNAASGTTLTVVNNTTVLWPQGTGTTLALRLESMYQAAIDKTRPGISDTTSDIVVLWSARRSSTVRQKVVANAVAASDMGRGRVGIVAADPATDSTATAALATITAANGLAAADGYAQPADRGIITFPHWQAQVRDFGNILVTVDGCSLMASTLSNFAEEVNPGAANDYIQDIQGLEPALQTSPLAKGDYANLIRNGVCALYKDRAAGWQWMQGVTAANASFPTRTPIKRRRMADLIQDSLAEQAGPYLKAPATTERVDALVMEHDTFLKGLLSPNNPSAQRIVAYKIDPDGGNTDDLIAIGIRTILVYVRILPSMDFIIYKTQIGETVTIPVTVAAAA
jgi:hypothetical protein